MPERCDICGVAALESERFIQEALPFARTKRYCPACRQRLYQKVSTIIAIVCLVVGAAGILLAWYRHASLLESPALQWSLLLVFQWLMILPHELGHALAGRALGFTQVRMLIGAGKPLFSIELFGLPAVINAIPVGGVTLTKAGDVTSRWRVFSFIGAGLLVNFTAAAIAWCFAGPGELFRFRSGSLLVPFFWANVLVLAENLFPYQAHTAFGRLNTDGLQLWNALFRWNKPVRLEPERLPVWSLALRHLLKWAGFLVMLGAMLFFVLVGVLPFFELRDASGWEIKIFLPVIMLALALVTGWAALRIAKHPIPKVAMPTFHASFGQVITVKSGQNDMLRQAIERARQNDFVGAEALLDQVLAGMPAGQSAAWLTLALVKLDYIFSQNDIGRAEKVCLDWVNQAPTTEEKLKLLDSLASQILYRSASAFFDKAERLVRQALELAPGSLTLKGSLGAILVEQGRAVEGEPLLRECLERSPALHDQGISAFYLGVVSLSTGNADQARQLIRRGMVLHPEPWLLAKAQARLKELRS